MQASPPVRRVPAPDPDRAALLADSLRTVSGVVLLTALFVAPLNYGSTRLLPFETLIALVATGGAAWLLAGAFARSLPLPPAIACAGIVLVAVAALAWIFVLAPPELPEFTRSHFRRIVRRWPNSVVPRDLPLMIAWALAALGGLMALCDLLRDYTWRRAAAAAMLLAGTSVAVIGLLQNATRARGIYWEETHRMPGAFFGTFFHHTAAGAFLNTVWPIGLSLVLLGLQRQARSPRARLAVYGALGCVAIVLAAHAAHVSRFPQVIAGCVLAAFVWWTGLWRALGRMRGLRLVVAATVAAVTLAVVVFGATRIGTIGARWNQLELADLIGGREAAPPAPPSEWRRLMRDDLFVPADHRGYPLGDRGAAYAAALDAIAARPWFGWGPGGWIAAAAAHSLDPSVRTFYLTVQFTHNDLLQAAVEWGLVGAAGWVLVVPLAAIFALRRLGRHPAADPIGAGAVAALAAVLVQSSIDFPLQIPAVQLNVVALAALAWSVPAARIAPVAVSPVSRP